jgi:6-phosphogluconate dehydrogenase
MAAEPVARVGILDGSRSLSALAQAIALALDGHATAPRTVAIHAAAGVDEFLSSDDARETKVVAATSAEDLCAKLEAPRCVLVFGDVSGADQSVRDLLEHLQPGDAVIDAASAPRALAAAAVPALGEEPAEGVQLLRCGFPGTLRRVIDGASIVVSCSEAAWAGGIAVEVLQQLGASDGRSPCVTRVGGGAIAHLTQQVHDSTELSILQLINEACHLLTVALRLQAGEVADVLESWGKSQELCLESHLLELTRDILRNPAAAASDGTAMQEVVARAAAGAPAMVSLGLANGAVVQTHGLSLMASVASRPAAFREEMAGLLLGPGSVESAIDRSSFIDLLGRAMVRLPAFPSLPALWLPALVALPDCLLWSPLPISDLALSMSGWAYCTGGFLGHNLRPVV